MIVWTDPIDSRVYIGLADQLVVRLTTADAARLRDDLVELLGPPAVVGTRPVEVASRGRRTAPTGR